MSPINLVASPSQRTQRTSQPLFLESRSGHSSPPSTFRRRDPSTEYLYDADIDEDDGPDFEEINTPIHKHATTQEEVEYEQEYEQEYKPEKYKQRDEQESLQDEEQEYLQDEEQDEEQDYEQEKGQENEEDRHKHNNGDIASRRSQVFSLSILTDKFLIMR